MDVREAEIHTVAFDGTGYAADENHGAIRFLPLDDSDMRQRVIDLAISIVIPCVIKEDEVAWTDGRSLVECAVLFYVRIDDSDTVRMGIGHATVVQVDAMFEEYCSGDAGAVIGDASAIAHNRFASHELGRRPHNGGSIRHPLDGSATGALCR